MRPTSGPRHLDSPTRSRSLLALAAAACFLLPLASAPYAEAAQAKASEVPKAVLDMVSASEANDEARVQSLRAQIEGLGAPTRGDRRTARKANDRGLEDLKREDFDAALAAFAEAAAADPADVEVMNNLAHTQFRAGRFAEAERTLLRVLTLAPGRTNAWAELGRVHGAQGLKDKAVAAFRTAYRFSKNQEKTAGYLQNLAEGGWGANATTQEAAGMVLSAVSVTPPMASSPKPPSLPSDSQPRQPVATSAQSSPSNAAPVVPGLGYIVRLSNPDSGKAVIVIKQSPAELEVSCNRGTSGGREGNPRGFGDCVSAGSPEVTSSINCEKLTLQVESGPPQQIDPKQGLMDDGTPYGYSESAWLAFVTACPSHPVSRDLVARAPERWAPASRAAKAMSTAAATGAPSAIIGTPGSVATEGGVASKADPSPQESPADAARRAARELARANIMDGAVPQGDVKILWNARTAGEGDGSWHVGPAAPQLALVNADAWRRVDTIIKESQGKIPSRPEYKAPDLRPKGEFEKTSEYQAWVAKQTESHKAEYEERLKAWASEWREKEAAYKRIQAESRDAFRLELEGRIPVALGRPNILPAQYDADKESFSITIASTRLKGYSVMATLAMDIDRARASKTDIERATPIVIFTMVDNRLTPRVLILKGDMDDYVSRSLTLSEPSIVFGSDTAIAFWEEAERRAEEEKKKLATEDKNQRLMQEQAAAARADSLRKSSTPVEALGSSALDRVWRAYTTHPGNAGRAKWINVRGRMIQTGSVPPSAVNSSASGRLPAYLACYDFVWVLPGLGDTEADMCLYYIDNPSRGTYALIWRGKEYMRQLESEMSSDGFVAN